MALIDLTYAENRLEEAQSLWVRAGNIPTVSSQCEEIQVLLLAAIEEWIEDLETGIRGARDLGDSQAFLALDPVVTQRELETEYVLLADCTLSDDNEAQASDWTSGGYEQLSDEELDALQSEAEEEAAAANRNRWLWGAGITTLIAGALLLVR